MNMHTKSHMCRTSTQAEQKLPFENNGRMLQMQLTFRNMWSRAIGRSYRTRPLEIAEESHCGSQEGHTQLFWNLLCEPDY